jgi:hypothetical protein
LIEYFNAGLPLRARREHEGHEGRNYELWLMKLNSPFVHFVSCFVHFVVISSAFLGDL